MQTATLISSKSKAFDDKILRKTPYRDNYIPTSELSGGIMQAEKYIFIYLNGVLRVKRAYECLQEFSASGNVYSYI
ncbi:hypothetical protein ECZU31_48650 [Escherichia coli]|nr:hypothetical protein ECZU31_48650 [Escherichia coli]